MWLVEEQLKNFYLLCLKIQRVNSYQNGKIGFILSFANNDGGLIAALIEKYQDDFYLFYTQSVAEEAKRYHLKKSHCQLFEKRNLLSGAFRTLSTMKVIIVDNYFPELSIIEESKIIQIWHATGAIKKFGWESPQTLERSQVAKDRFQKVYNQMTAIVVGSKAMKEIFVTSYRIPSNRVKMIGTPRSQYFLHRIESNLVSDFLYAPTYRDSPQEMMNILDGFMRVAVASPAVNFIIHLHPSLRREYETIKKIPENVTFSTTDDLVTLFSQVKGMISDYSSTAIDFHSMYPEKPVLFYCPDIESYRKTTGVQSYFETTINQQVLKTQIQLQNRLMESTIGEQERDFLSSWHTYNDEYVLDRILALIAAKFH